MWWKRLLAIGVLVAAVATVYYLAINNPRVPPPPPAPPADVEEATRLPPPATQPPAVPAPPPAATTTPLATVPTGIIPPPEKIEIPEPPDIKPLVTGPSATPPRIGPRSVEEFSKFFSDLWADNLGRVIIIGIVGALILGLLLRALWGGRPVVPPVVPPVAAAPAPVAPAAAAVVATPVWRPSAWQVLSTIVLLLGIGFLIATWSVWLPQLEGWVGQLPNIPEQWVRVIAIVVMVSIILIVLTLFRLNWIGGVAALAILGVAWVALTNPEFFTSSGSAVASAASPECPGETQWVEVGAALVPISPGAKCVVDFTVEDGPLQFSGPSGTFVVATRESVHLRDMWVDSVCALDGYGRLRYRLVAR